MDDDNVFEPVPKAEFQVNAVCQERIERRKIPRKQVRTKAKLIIDSDGTVLNCVVLNLTEEGAMVDVDIDSGISMATVAALQLETGGTFLAKPKWAAEAKIGLNFVGGQIISGETARRMRAAADVLDDRGIMAAIETIRLADNFNVKELRHLGNEAEASIIRLRAFLVGEPIKPSGVHARSEQ